MAEEWLKDGIVGELTEADSSNETRSRAKLQEALGVGAGDMERALAELREEGRASESAPGEWELAGESYATQAPDPPAVEAPAQTWVPAMPSEETMRAIPPNQSPEMRLSRAMVDALDDEALGRVVKAGMAGSAGDFVLRVTP